MWLMLFYPDLWNHKQTHTVWMFDWRNMVAVIHPAMLYFAYINDPLIHLRKKVNLSHHPLKLTGLDAGDYRHKTPSRDNFLMITTLIFLDFPMSISRNPRRKKSCSQETKCANVPLIVWRKYMLMAAVRSYLVCIYLKHTGCKMLAFWFCPDIIEFTSTFTLALGRNAPFESTLIKRLSFSSSYPKGSFCCLRYRENYLGH